MVNSETRIRLKKETAKKLKKLVEFGESYDQVINKILESYEKE